MICIINRTGGLRENRSGRSIFDDDTALWVLVLKWY